MIVSSIKIRDRLILLKARESEESLGRDPTLPDTLIRDIIWRSGIYETKGRDDTAELRQCPNVMIDFELSTVRVTRDIQCNHW